MEGLLQHLYGRYAGIIRILENQGRQAGQSQKQNRKCDHTEDVLERQRSDQANEWVHPCTPCGLQNSRARFRREKCVLIFQNQYKISKNTDYTD